MNNDSYNYKPQNDRDKILDEVRGHLGFSKKKDGEKPLSDEELDKDLIKKLHESDPHQKSKMFSMIQRNPPQPSFMEVTCHKAIYDGVNVSIMSKSVQLEDGSVRWIEIDPFYAFSPYIGFKADIAAAPLWTSSQLLDEKEMVEFEDKRAHTPEKRKDKKEMLYVYILIASIIGSIAAGAFLLFGRG